MIPEIIYCADGNKRFASIAIESGFTYGAQLPNTVYHPPEFVDQNWKSPDLDRYVDAVVTHLPRMASVLDLEKMDQIDEVLRWSCAISPYVRDCIIIIPKVSGAIKHLPREIEGIPIRLGYSVPTLFGASSVSLVEFLGWPIHLLGGGPIAQLGLYGDNGVRRLLDAPRLNVVSVDCNYHLLMATRYNQFFVRLPNRSYKNRYWPTIVEADGEKWGDGSNKADAPYEAFRRSSINIMNAWKCNDSHV